MPVTVAMYEKSFDYIGKKLAALDLDVSVLIFNRDGQFLIDGTPTPPDDISVDYLWLSTHLNVDGVAKMAFRLALACKSVGVLQTFNAGLDDPFYKAAAAKGIRICNSSAQGVAIAEYVMAQVLGILHPLDRQRQQQQAETWKITPFREISCTNWLIIGYGAIGEAIARRVKAFGATTAVVRRSPRTSDLVDKAGTLADMKQLLPDADIIVLACALNDETRDLADVDFFGSVKDGAILINVARGGLVDEDTLVAALDSGRLEAAVLDVFREEPLPAGHRLWSHPRIRLTPHTSFAGDGGSGRWERLFLDNIGRFVRNEPLIREVDPADI